MKNTNKLILILLLFSVALYSCKKSSNNKNDDTDDGYYIKYKLDGVDKNLVQAHGGITSSGSVNGANLYGRFSGDTAKESSILILDSIPINTNKTYKCTTVLVNGKNTVAQTSFTYYDEQNTRYFAVYTGPGLEINVKFSEITSSHIKGTFTAVIRQYYDKQPYHFYQLTEGEFNLKRDY
jgi:hypothetical protein